MTYFHPFHLLGLIMLGLALTSCGTPVLISPHLCQRRVDLTQVQDRSQSDIEISRTHISPFGDVFRNVLSFRPCEILDKELKGREGEPIQDFEIITSFGLKEILLGFIPFVGFRKVLIRGNFQKEEGLGEKDKDPNPITPEDSL